MVMMRIACMVCMAACGLLGCAVAPDGGGSAASAPAMFGDAMVIDVRTAAEFDAGHLAGALHIPYEQVDALVAAIGPDQSRSVVLYCRTGRRSGIALQSLMQAGYTNVVNAGGYRDLIGNASVAR